MRVKIFLNHYLIFCIATYLVAMLFGFSPALQAQHDYLHQTPIDFFDLPNSLEGNEVQDVFQDRAGYMWFASKAGLVKYNGRNFKVYNYRASDTTSISSDEVERILETRDGTIWIGTWGGGLNRFNHETGTFTRFKANEDGTTGLSNNFVADLVEDVDGKIWIATRGGLNRLDPKTGEFEHFLPVAGDETSISSKEVRTLLLDEDNTLWVGTGYPWDAEAQGGMNRFARATETFTRYLQHPGTDRLKNDVITAMFEDKDGKFWVGTLGNHIHLFDRTTGKFSYQEDLSQFALKGESTHIRSFFQDIEDGGLWILSYGAGLKKYDSEKRSVSAEIWGRNPDGKSNYALNQAWGLFASADGTLWAYTGSIGEKVYKSRKLMPHIGMAIPQDVITSASIDTASSMAWFCRQFNGLAVGNWNADGPTYTYHDDIKAPWKGHSSNPDDLSDTGLFDNITVLTTEGDDVAWFAKAESGDGVFRMDASKRELENFSHDSTNPASLANDTILHLSSSKVDSFIWAVSSDGTLNRINQSTKEVKHYTANNIPGFPEKPLETLVAKTNKLWTLGAGADGELVLGMLPKEGGVFEAEELVRYPGELPEITGFLEGQGGTFWVGTEKHLIRQTTTGDVVSYDLTSNNLGKMRSFLQDQYGSIWMATTMGVAVFHPEREDFYLFSEDFPLIAQPYELRSATSVNGDELFFCGKGGCTYINRSTLDHYYNQQKEQEALPSSSIIFSAFLLNGKEIAEGPLSIDSITVNREITLRYDQNSFSLELALLDFDQPEGNHFEYFLEGYDTYWRRTGGRNNAYFAQVPPGTYPLKVRGYNSMNAYGEAMPIIVVITPPWWLTWWAYGAYLISAGGLLLLFYRFQLSRQLAKSEARRLQELDVAKSQLYTNITHEFRTPLTVILGMTDQLSREVSTAQREVVQMIDRNGHNLLNLVNQLLDLAKLDSGTMSLNLQQSDLISYLKYLVESFHSYAENRGVKIHFISDLESQEMDFDPIKIQQIVANILSNAIKFTPTGGDIYFSVDPSVVGDDRLTLRVKDTGAGIDPGQLPYIFKRFYQADETTTREFPGTGIGLALVSELVKLMGGTISAKSELGKGTEIMLKLPITQSAVRNTDFDLYERAKINFYREGVEQQLPEDTLPEAVEDLPTVLVVEDNFDVRAYIKACLSDRFQLLTAENGFQGVEMAIEHIPDFIISDVMMPRKDGYTLARELKADERTSHIPIILLTAKVDVDSRMEGISHGVDAYLAKPFNPRELRLRIRKLLESRQRLQRYYLGLDTSEVAQDSSGGTKATEDVFVNKVRKVITEDLTNTALDVGTLCRELGMSQSQLHRKLSALTGLSANRFIRHVRLEKSRELLRNQELSVNEVAYASGYKDPSYFGRVFKQDTGQTPAEWRKSGCAAL